MSLKTDRIEELIRKQHYRPRWLLVRNQGLVAPCFMVENVINETMK
jgi:hypothetical protein